MELQVASAEGRREARQAKLLIISTKTITGHFYFDLLVVTVLHFRFRAVQLKILYRPGYLWFPSI